MKKRWTVFPVDTGLQQVLGRELNITPLTAQLLINRGLVDSGKAFSFLKPDLKDLHDPFLLKDMDKAVERIVSAMDKREKIAVYGDYDVDGTTSTAMLHLFFRELGIETVCYIPDRISEGYGLNSEALKKLCGDGVKLIITVDCGSSNRDEVSFARSLGLDIIVSDHHELPGEPPEAAALLNPKQNGCAFPFKGLAGVGVAFNLIMALRFRLRKLGWFTAERTEPNLKKYLDLVSIGTVADMVPLVDENRVLVSHGIKELERTEREGLKALKEVAGIRAGKADADSIAFQLAPRINAAGRLTKASTALKLLITNDPGEASALADALNRENASRQRLEAEILGEALSMIGGGVSDKGVVLFSEGWHPGVIGIVASRLVERFSRPAVMIAVESSVGKGSARGIKSFDMLEGLKACSGLLERYGGHKGAAGLTVARENIERFRDEFIVYLNSTLTDEDLIPEIICDAEVSLDRVDHRMIREIQSLSPFGASNREPLLYARDANIIQTEVVGARHLRFRVAQNGCSRSGIGFGLAGLHPIKGERFALAFSPYLDEWQGGKNLKLRIKDVETQA
jgi:single-stranded-DNA-specific exonuclease